MYFTIVLLILNLIAYLIMVIDKLKSIYKWWRISEKTLWLIALAGGVFGIWIGMLWPMYHKAGKGKFRIWIPTIGIIWLFLIVYFLIRK